MVKHTVKFDAQALALGWRGMPPRSSSDLFHAAFPILPTTRDSNVVLTSATVEAWIAELAKLNPREAAELLQEYDLNAGETIPPDMVQTVGEAVRELLDKERAKVSSGGGLQLSSSACSKQLSPKAKKRLAAVTSRSHFENIDPDKFYARKT